MTDPAHLSVLAATWVASSKEADAERHQHPGVEWSGLDETAHQYACNFYETGKHAGLSVEQLDSIAKEAFVSAGVKPWGRLA